MSEQPLEESLTDRIAGQFEDQPEAPVEEQPEPEKETEAEAAPEVVEVEYNGKAYQVPPELKDALMAQADYTKKTSEVAEQRRLVELEQQQIKSAKLERQFHESVKDDILQAQRIEFQLEQFKEIDATGLSAEQAFALMQRIQSLKDKKEELTRTIQGKYGKYEQDQMALARETQSKAEEIASKAVPNWSPETQKQLREYAVSVGFKADEVSGITDPRVVKILWQAAQYQKLQQAKLMGKVTSTPAVKPGSSNPMPQDVKDKFALKKALKSAPNSAAKAKAIEAELMRRF